MSALPIADVTVIYGDPRLADETKVGHRFSPEDVEAIARMKEALASLLPDGHVTYLDDHTTLLETLRADPPTFVLNLCDTGFRNDARRELHVPAYLEMLKVPYSGCPPPCLAFCYDKAAVRAVAQVRGVPVPAETFVDLSADGAYPTPDAFPALIKPSTGDGSLGITADSVVHDPASARAYLDRLRRALPGRDALIQEYLTGDEYAVGLVGNPEQGFHVLPPLAVDYSALDADLPRILSYESKTVPTSPYWTQIGYQEADLDADLRDAMVDAAQALFERFGCRDAARFDFRTDAHGQPKLLEVNPNPAWCWDGKMNLMAGFEGLSYADYLRLLLEAAQERISSADGV